VTFDAPPVTEVALAIQFDEPTVETLEVAAFFTRIRKDLPRQIEQPARPPIEERFDELSPAEPFQFQLLDRPPMPRFWFLSEDESRLVQVQHDFLAVNWRKMQESNAYPRYRVLRRDLARYAGLLEDGLTQEGKERLQPAWCEITYINHIDAATKRGSVPLDAILTVVRSAPEKSFLPMAEDSQVAQRFVIKEGDEPIGRLHMSAAPAYRTVDGAPIWVLTLTARLRTKQPTIRGALSRLDLGHRWTLGAFTDLTTKPMQRKWKVRKERS
jgi:uncharacterized protein (TIGR04255 family)